MLILFRFKKCVKRNMMASIIIYLHFESRPNVLHTTYVACCSNFVNFQINLLKVTDSFPLATLAYNYAEIGHYGDVDFGYGVDLDLYDEDLPIDDRDNDDDDFDDDDDGGQSFKQADTLNSSVCYTQMRLGPFRFTRFCLHCQQIFLLYFINQLHIITNG